MDKRKQIFPVSYYQGQVENNDILKEQLLSRINFTKNKVQVPPGWTTTKIITSIDSDKGNKFLYENEELTNQYIDTIESFCDDDYIIEIDEMWFNYYIDGEYQEQHNHIDSAQEQRRKTDRLTPTFSCVHFLCYDKEVHSPLTFFDPMRVTRSHSFEFASHQHDDIHAPDISEGDIIMFPSYLEHEVKAGKPTPNNPRITISFNLKLYLMEDDNYILEEDE